MVDETSEWHMAFDASHITAAFDEWLAAQTRSPALPINDVQLEKLATLITYKLVEAGLVDDLTFADDSSP